MTDWKKCFICQQSKNEPLRSTKECLETLSRNIPEFNECGILHFDYNRLYDRVSNDTLSLLTIFMNNNACYHNQCSSKYSNSKLQRAKLSIQKRAASASKNDTSAQPTEKRTRRSFDNLVSQEETKKYCCWCRKLDLLKNLHAAGQKGAKKKPDAKHVDDVTTAWKQIAAALGNDYVLGLLAGGDVSSNELFYHGRCLLDNQYKYKELTKVKSDDKDDKWLREICLNKIIMYLRDTEMFNPGTLFTVCDVENIYCNMLHGYGINSSTHTSRFADTLVARVPGLMKVTKGNKVRVFFDSAVLQKPGHGDDPTSFFASLIDIIEPIRRAMHKKCQKDKSEKFDYNAQVDSVPIELLTLINFVQDGINISEKGFTKESLSISQTLMYNFRSNRDKKKPSLYKRHDRAKETPFPLYVAVKVYSTSRSKTLVNWLNFCAGLSISYNRLLDVTKDMASRMLAQYDRDGVFIPRNLLKKVFTIFAKDNIDFNSRSTTATKHYHGTSLSIFQFPTTDNPGETIEYDIDLQNERTKTKSKKIERLPESFTLIRHFLTPLSTLRNNNQPPNPVLPTSQKEEHEKEINEEFKWLKGSFDQASSTWIPWVQYHAAKERTKVRIRDITAILPLIDNVVHTLDMQYHLMTMIKKTMNILNPNQICVDVADEPIFALTQELIKRFPEHFGPDKYFCLLGSLHIEKSVLALCGQLIKGSGLEQLMSSCGLSIVGADALVTVNHIKRARYCLQIASCVIYKKLVQAFQESDTNIDIKEWLDKQSKTSEMCFFWKIVLELMVETLVFVRSIREGNFSLYVASLRSFVKWHFALDHYNYARWLSIHLYDLYALPQNSPQLYNYFMDGYFTFQKSRKEFSLMGLDQVHEQNNARIKGMGGATSFLNKEDESAVARWGLCTHELSSLIAEYEGDDEPDDSDIEHHHENTDAFKDRFTKDVNALQRAMISNPFQLLKLTVLNQEGASFNGSVFEDIKILRREGELQFLDFWNQRLSTNSISIKEPITKNSFNLLGNQSTRAIKDPVMTAKMMDKLKDAAQNRRLAVEKVLNTEVFGIAQSLAKDQFSLYHGTKSHIVDPFTAMSVKPSFEGKTKCGIVIELSLFLRKKRPTWVFSFHDFAEFLYNEIMDLSKSFQRCDVVIDRYFADSLKEGVREERGSGLVLVFDDKSDLPSNFESNFLSNNINKTNLNEYLVKKFISFHQMKESELCVTFKDTVLVNRQEVTAYDDIRICSSEEADPRLVRHAIHLGKCGYNEVVIKTIDCDVFVLSHANANLLHQLGVTKFFVIYGPKSKWYDIFENCTNIGWDICKGLPFFHAFTGCDCVSSFYRIGKSKFWKAWQEMHQTDLTLTKVFIDLSNQPASIDETTFNNLCSFVYSIYGNKYYNDLPFKTQRTNLLIETPDANLRTLVPSTSGILQHIKRACFQAGYLWKLCDTEVSIPNPEEWGWKRHIDNSFIPRWQDEIPSEIADILNVCSCVKGVCDNCSCKKSAMKCLKYCKCVKKTCKNQ